MSLKFEAVQRPVSALRCSHRFSPNAFVTLVGDSDDELYVEVGSRIQTTSILRGGNSNPYAKNLDLGEEIPPYMRLPRR